MTDRIETDLGQFVQHVFPEETARREAGECPFCEKPVVSEDFRDTLSRKEFEISGLCQECQDGFFGK